ncbi:MAG: extracellular solute-binding protein [Lachnospiraceae bacterium]|nr:extracellular solute-binding protein [Lachnospiraceae bacterium]
MKKRIAALFLVLSMAAAMFAGCANTSVDETKGNTEAPAEQTKAPEDDQATDGTQETEAAGIPVDYFAGTELTIAVKKHNYDTGESWGDKPAMKAAEEATGIKINWIMIDSGQSERINAMLAGDMPDAFIGNMIKANTIAANMDLFYDLSEEGLLETYAPDALEDIKQLNGGLDLITWPDGSIRSLITNDECNYNNDAEGIMVINKAWLDKLGLGIPKTADEFYNVLCAFRDNDMDGDGDPTNEIPFNSTEKFWAGKIIQGANSWGIAGYNNSVKSHYFQLKDGKVTSTVDTDEFRAYLEFYHKLMDEGLLNMDCFSETNDQRSAKLLSGNVGVFWSWTPQDVGDLELAKDYVTLPPFQALEGVEPVKSGTRDKETFYNNGFVISAECENVEALLHWWNYLSSSTEMKYFVKFGEKGTSWDIDANGNVYLKRPDDITEDFTESNHHYTYGWSSYSPLILKEELPVVDTSDPYDSTAWRTLMVDEVYDMLPTDTFSTKKFVSPEAEDEKDFIEDELDAYLTNFVATSIVEGVTDDSWNAHLEQLKTVQYYEWLEWYQKYIDGTLE